MIIGTVKGNLHDIGKNLVGAMLEGGGFHIVDLGVDVEPRRFVAAVKEIDARVIAMSALLTTTMEFMRKTVEALNEAGLRDQVKIIIGGAPITPEYADEIGTDGYAANRPRRSRRTLEALISLARPAVRSSSASRCSGPPSRPICMN